VKKLIMAIMAIVLLVGCSDNEEIETIPVEGEKEPQQEVMMNSKVKYYLSALTGSYAMAYNISSSDEDKMSRLNDAITDINLAVMEIEDEYTSDVEPTEDLLRLADLLLDIIDNELLGDLESAYENSVKAGEIIGKLSTDYLDGELPIGIKQMIED